MLRILGIAFLMITVIVAPGCGDGSSSMPGTRVISISPASAAVGNPGLTLTLTGSGFSGARHNFSQAVWSINGSNTLLATTFVNSTQLTAVIPAALLSSPATAQIFVQTGDPMGDVPLSRTNTVSFSVTTTVPGPTSPGIPTISSISPTSAAAGSPDLTLTVTGSNFVRNLYYFSQAVWSVNGVKTSLPTISSSSNQLTVLIPAALLSNAVSAQVFVQTADQDGIPRFKSNSVIFSVN